jgi:molecular chaperone Hsp31 and glyoxalase 3
MSKAGLSRQPTPDKAEYNAFFPSPYSLAEYTSSRSDLDGADYPNPYTGSRRILVIAADERYLPTDNGALFSTGNHPVETLVPMYHLRKAGFDFDIATLSGEMVKFELWAMPAEDKAITGLHKDYLGSFLKPHRLSDIVAGLGPQTDYAGVFIPGGHGALIGLPGSEDVAAVIRWVMDNDRHLISLCHGPAAFLALAANGKGSNPLRGYSICAFPDAADRQTPDIGYMPGHLTWYFGERLKAMGMTIVNDDIAGATHQDRKVITGDSPFAANALGKLAATALLKDAAGG